MCHILSLWSRSKQSRSRAGAEQEQSRSRAGAEQEQSRGRAGAEQEQSRSRAERNRGKELFDRKGRKNKKVAK